MTSPAERDALVKRLKQLQATMPDVYADDIWPEDALSALSDAIAALTAHPSDGEPVAYVNLELWKSSTRWPDDCFHDLPVGGINVPLYAHPAPSNPVADRGETSACPICEGSGKVKVPSFSNPAKLIDNSCNTCRGRGYLRASPAPAESSPETVVVPREPTEAMLDAAVTWRNTPDITHGGSYSMRDQFAECYRAMLAASPDAQKGES